MAFIHKESFDVIQSCDIEGLDDDYFEVDDLIALPIQILNRKGYKTRFCCAGHPFETLGESVVPFEISVEDSFFVGTFKVEKLVDGKFRALYRQAQERSSYIIFDKGITLPFLPKDFGIDEDKEDGDAPMRVFAVDENGNEVPCPLDGTTKLATYYEEEMPIYEFYAEVIEAMTCLHEWALSLPTLEESN